MKSLQAFLALGPVFIPLLVDHACEGIFELAGNAVSDSDHACEEQSRGLSVPQRGRQEAECRAVVHRRVGDVEWERGHGRVHEDTEVITQVGAGDAERPHRGQDERVSGEEERDGGVFHEWVLEERGGGLVGEGFVVAIESRLASCASP